MATEAKKGLSRAVGTLARPAKSLGKKVKEGARDRPLARLVLELRLLRHGHTDDPDPDPNPNPNPHPDPNPDPKPKPKPKPKPNPNPNPNPNQAHLRRLAAPRAACGRVQGQGDEGLRAAALLAQLGRAAADGAPRAAAWVRVRVRVRVRVSPNPNPNQVRRALRPPPMHALGFESRRAACAP